MTDERREDETDARPEFTSLQYLQAEHRGRCPDHLDREIPDDVPCDAVTIVRSHRRGRCPDHLDRDI
jgi:hypothetical protein